PALVLPVAASVVATAAQGTPVTFAVSASDTADAAPRVSCTPASGAPFPLGVTRVTCTASDRSGNSAQGTFDAQVVVSWSNLLAPINPGGLTSFLRLVPVPVQFALTGPSAHITDLGARLYVAPVDAQGNVNQIG